MRSKKILLVDDDKELCEELVISLKDNGYEVVSARSGEEALEKAEYSQLDLVLMDMKMTGMGGIKAAKCFKEIYPKLPIIIITGALPSETEVQLAKIPSVKVLYKTFDIEFLINEVEKFLNPRG